jgi:hypothetical protein
MGSEKQNRFLALIGQKPGEDSRNSKYDPEYCEKIKIMAQDGMFPEEWACEIGVTLWTFKNWAQKYPDFNEALVQSRLLLTSWWTKKLRDTMSMPSNPTVYGLLARRFTSLYGTTPVDLMGWMLEGSDEETSDSMGPVAVKAVATDDLVARLSVLEQRKREAGQ